MRNLYSSEECAAGPEGQIYAGLEALPGTGGNAAPRRTRVKLSDLQRKRKGLA